MTLRVLLALETKVHEVRLSKAEDVIGIGPGQDLAPALQAFQRSCASGGMMPSASPSTAGLGLP